jgi:hypothetical protein
MDRRTLGAFHPVEKHARYGGAELIARLENRGERWAGQGKLADGMEHTQRNHVIAGENSGRQHSQQKQCFGMAAGTFRGSLLNVLG